MYQYYPHEHGFMDVQFRDGTWMLFDPDQDASFYVELYDADDVLQDTFTLGSTPPIQAISTGKFKVEDIPLTAFAEGVAYYRWYAKLSGVPLNMYPVFEYCFQVLEATSGSWLCTLADLRTYLKIATADTAQDDHLENLIGRATAFIQTITRRTIVSIEHTVYVSGDGTNTLMLRNYPLTAVALVEDSLSGQEDFSFTGADLNTEFGFEDDGELILMGGDVFRLPGSTYPARNYKVTYTAGYPARPEDLRQVCVELAAAKYYLGEKQQQNVATKTFGGETITYRADDLSPAQKLIIDRYVGPAMGPGV
jgi:hypothetical protein